MFFAQFLPFVRVLCPLLKPGHVYKTGFFSSLGFTEVHMTLHIGDFLNFFYFLVEQLFAL